MDAMQARALIATRFHVDLLALRGVPVEVEQWGDPPIVAVFRGLLVDERGEASAVVEGREPGMLVEVHPSRLRPGLYAQLTLNCGWYVLDPVRRRRWWPDEGASEEIGASGDAERTVLRLCMDAAERGRWEPYDDPLP